MKRTLAAMSLFVLLAGEMRGAEPPTRRWAEFVETNFPFFSSVLDARQVAVANATNNLTPRGLILNLGHDLWACFDTDLLRVAAVWRGQAVTPVSMAQGSYHNAGLKAQEGQAKLPQTIGTPWMVNGIYPGWQAHENVRFDDPRAPGPDPREVGRGPLPETLGRFKAVRVQATGADLEYTAAGTIIRERMSARIVDGRPIMQRVIQFDKVQQPLWLVLGYSISNQLNVLLAHLSGGSTAQHVQAADGLHSIRVHPSSKPVTLAIVVGAGALRTWTEESPRAREPRWAETITTRATLSSATDAYVVDHISLPTTNPWRRNVRIADIAFLGDGRAAAVTFDGDVWMLSGLRGELREITWRRFTSGLHEPLSIALRGKDLFVFDRNGIWRLRDADGNGEAEVHELFSNAFTQTAETREFACSMRVAPDGTFVIAKGGQQSATVGRHNGSVLRVAADGQSVQVLAHGLRQPFIGVHPVNGFITASDQQGHYIPTTPLHVINADRYYGFVPTFMPTEKYTEPIADPLTWIPHPINASGAAQVWLANARMGPLNDTLLHIGYYRPELFVVPLNQRAERLQAAVISLTRDFNFPPLYGAVNPADGQLYVAGFQIWGTVAKEVSGLARVRYTGRDYLLPREVAAFRQGILLRFDVPLDASLATNAANYSVERWNYQRSSNYGSPHFKLDGSKGQETLAPSSAYLSRDGKAVFIGVPDMQRVMQMRVGWAIASHSGAKLMHNAYFTPHELTPFNARAEGFEAVAIDLTRRTQVLASAATPITVEEGRRVSELMGCVACHSTDGSMLGKVGPTWKGLAGASRPIAKLGTVVADDVYLRESIREPAAKIISGFEKTDTGMPSYEGILSEAQIEALVLYIKSLR